VGLVHGMRWGILNNVREVVKFLFYFKLILSFVSLHFMVILIVIIVITVKIVKSELEI